MKESPEERQKELVAKDAQNNEVKLDGNAVDLVVYVDDHGCWELILIEVADAMRQAAIEEGVQFS